VQFPRGRVGSCLAAAMVWFGLGAATAAQQRIVIVGSGSNVPVYLYQAWTSKFNASNDNVQVRYMPLGTSESIRQIKLGIGDFGGGEILLTDEQMRDSKIGIMIPTILVGIVPIYNLPGNPELNFSGGLLGEIYLGAVKNWKDPQIAHLNPTIELPDLPISVIHRSAGKGSNFIFTNFVSRTNLRFRVEVGRSPSPRWPLGLEADLGQDMVKKVAATRGAIGYVDIGFLRNSSVGYGRVENAAGRFVKATPASIEAACTALESSIPNDFRMDLTDAPGKDSYPLVSFTWLYVPISDGASPRSRALKQFLDWSFEEGQRVAVSMGYAPLPGRIVAKAQAAVNALR
jgi:phosphate transport system substrate-binding protein